MFIVPTAVEVAREQALLAEKYISNGDETDVLNEFNLVQMSNVCSFGKPKRNTGHDKERKKKGRQKLRTKKDDAFKLQQPDLLAKISTLEQHNLQTAAEIESLKEVNLSLSFLSVVLIIFLHYHYFSFSPPPYHPISSFMCT